VIRAAARYPRRVSSLVLFQSSPVWVETEDLPWESPIEASIDTIESMRRSPTWDEWAREYVRSTLPSHADDDHAIAWFATMTRLTEAPGSAVSHVEALTNFDVRADLDRITAPTLVLHRPNLKHQGWRIESSRYIAERIPKATMVEVPGSDDFIWAGDWEPTVAEIERFLTGRVERHEPEAEVATVLFTDIVNSTGQAASMGDRRWTELREQHDREIRGQLRRFRGEEIETAGDGFLATFATPRQAVRCAVAAVDVVRSLGLEIRAGVHTGEIEREGDGVRGIAVHIGARVSSLAGAGEILVSQTVKDLVAGSGFGFDDAGEHELKGVPGRWRLYLVQH
jgi:class 3 adenylate cyclase